MTDPKIRYDILANAEGQEDVARLARELEKLDGAIDPASAARAAELAAQLRQLGAQDKAISAFGELKQKTLDARQALDQAQQAAQAYGRQIAATEAPTRQQAGQMEKLRDAVRSAKTELQNQTGALDASRRALGTLGVETEGLARAQVRVRNEMGATALEAAVVAQRYQQVATAAEASARSQVAAQSSVQGSLAGLQRQIQGIQNLALALVGGSIVGGMAKDVADVADGYNNLAARIRLVTGEGQAFTQAFEGVFEVAKRTGASLETTGNLFTRIAEAGKQIGVSQAQALALTESINQAVQLSGTGAQESDAAIRQLIQGLQSGVLRGEEFNSVMEQAPRLAKALADGLGVTTGQLRKLAEAGELSSSSVISALQGQSAALKREFDTLPPTIGRALQNLSTEWTKYIGSVDAANGVSSKAASAIAFLADNLDTVATAVTTAGQAFIAYKAIDFAGALLRDAAATQGSVAARRAETLAVAGATAARAANTTATSANTAALAANATAATAAGAAANTAAAAGAATTASVVGRLVGALGLAGTAVVLFGDLAVSAFRTAGTWIGETAAKLAGYRDRSEEVLAAQKRQEEATKALAASTAELAQKAQLAAEKTLGLNDESRRLVGIFTEAEKKGEGTAAALAKVTKALELGDTSGINAAVTALDVLERRGKIAGYTIQEALSSALKTQDLGIFEAQVKATFRAIDASARALFRTTAEFEKSDADARRLKLALDAIHEESLRRVGTSLQEMQTGFSKASAAAINDTDALRRTLKELGTDAETSGNLLAKSIDKQIEAASTEKALQRARTTLVEMGKSGELAGDAVASRLQQIDLKSQEARRGINGLAEALSVLGIKGRDELQSIATKSREAFDIALASGQVSAKGLAQAYQKMAEDAIAANGGIEPSWLRQRQIIVENRLSAAGLAGELTKGMKDAAEATETVTKAQGRLATAITNVAGAIRSTPDGDVFNASGRQARNDSFKPFQSGSGASQATTTQTQPPDNSGDWVFDVEGFNRATAGNTSRLTAVDPRRFWVKRTTSGFGAATDPFNAVRSQLAQGIDPVTGLPFPGTTAGGTPTPTPIQPTTAAEPTTVDTDTPGTVGRYTAVPILGKYEVSLTNERTGITTNTFTDTAEQAQAFIDNLQQAFRTANGG